MAVYQSSAEIRESLTEEELAKLVAALPKYELTEKVAEYFPDTSNPDILFAFSEFASSIMRQWPDATISGMTVIRPKAQAELEEAALTREASNRYYLAQKAEKGEQ